MLGNSSWDLFLQPGSCNPNNSYINAKFDANNFDPAHFNNVSNSTSWSFIRLENDGRLYIYGVLNPAGRPSLEQHALDSTGAVYFRIEQDALEWEPVLDSMPFFAWGKCDVPMACGPLGVCTPDAPDPCTNCPQLFDPIVPLDFSKGCQHQPTSRVPPCQHSNNKHIQYLQLNATASIFLFSGWTFDAFMSAPVEACRESCTLNCSCTGFFYQANTSSCFFISDDQVSLLSVTNKSLNLMFNIPQSFAKDYVTYLKVAAGSINATSGNKETNDNQGNQANYVFLMPVLAAVVACVVVGMAVYCLLRARKQRLRKMSEQQNEEDLKDILPLLPSRFSYKDLREATGGFSNLLGAGGCGSVYAGILPDGRKVAVKMLEFLLKGQSKQFLAEVATIGRTNHVNIVHLVGFCWEVSHRLLVYEYVELGSLDHWLFSNADTLTGNGVDDGAIIQAPLLD